MINFKEKPILGMIHLSNDDAWGVTDRALNEIKVYQEEGLAGVIIENYHSGLSEVKDVLCEVAELKTTGHISPDLNIGINILPNDYQEAFKLADLHGFDFIQMDYVSGKYQRSQEINESEYLDYRTKYPNIQVLGGVWPKYYTPVGGSSLENDLKIAIKRCDAIVVTGSGTGKATPMDKIKMFRDIIGDFPLIIGAGVTPDNVKSQFEYGDGAIVGSTFKNHSITTNMVNRKLVKEFMKQV